MFLICTFIGFFLGENYKRRSIQLKEFQKGLLLLSNEIIYANTPLPDALMEVSKRFIILFQKYLMICHLH